MAKFIRFGILVFVLQMIKECWPIPLPGVKLHAEQVTDASFFPYPDLDFHDTSKVEPSFRGIIPKFNNTILEQLQRTHDSETTTTTENPLAKLLDKLYGNNNWRELLEQSVHNSAIPTASIPPLTETTEKQTAQQGFYGTEISGNRFDDLFRKQEVATQKPNNPKKPSSSKFLMKIVGTRQHVSTDSPSVETDAHEGPIQQWGLDTNTPSLFMKVQERGQGPPITMKPPPMSMTQKPLMSIGGIGAFDPNRVNSISGDQSYYQNSGTNNFNTNQANNGQYVFHPNSAFNSLITQTGSDPSNRLLPVSYDADAVNGRYMTANANGMQQGYPGVAEETVYGKEQFGYRFSAYSEAHPQSYDANALNQALMENNRNMQQQPMGPMFLPASRVQQPTQQSYRSVTHIDVNKNSPTIQKADTSPQILPVQERFSLTTPRPTQTFNFIPGNLFPGQSNQMAGQQIVGVAQEASPPEFLRHIPMATGSDAFNPNSINAAQAVYNPNALSWIKTRDTETVERQSSQEIEEVNNTTTLAVTTPSYVSTANILSGTTAFMEVNSTTIPVINENAIQKTGSKNNSDTNASTGFDPNVLNSNQGQSEFIPGQISPALYGYMSNPYNQGKGQSYGNIQNKFSPYKQGSPGDSDAKMTFNIAQLLGMNTGATGKDTDGVYGQDTASFNPNIINSMMTASFGDNGSNSTTNMGGFGMGFVGTGFDPNAANQGFANVLSQGNALSNQSNGYMGGYGGFDPNAANTGFGEGGFGMGGAGTSGGAGYMAAFDPNKVNQMAIQNPFEQGVNGTGSGSMVGYYLGISQGNNQGHSGAYTSAYISAFNPDSVNQASYDPNKYNQVHLHLDPIDMLINNPGMDKDTLKAAASAFDPDKLNSPNMQQAFSPIEMLSANPGIDKTVLSNLKYDPYAGTGVPSSRNDSVPASATGPSGKNVTSTPVFDPIALMAKLMQSAGAFQPGDVGRGQQSLDPSSMFGNLNGVTAQQAKTSIKQSTPIPKYTTQAPPHPSMSLPSSASPSVSSTTAAVTTSTGSNNVTVV